MKIIDTPLYRSKLNQSMNEFLAKAVAEYFWLFMLFYASRYNFKSKPFQSHKVKRPLI